MSDNNPYRSFSRFFLRAPLFNLNFFESTTDQYEISDDQIKDIYNDPVVKEAIFLASPVLYSQANKWIAGDLNTKKEDKLKVSLLRYLTRMTSRCTPFGLFAGCTVGKVDDSTKINFSDIHDHVRFTRPDMNFLIAFSQELAKKDLIKGQIKFFPNSSLYQYGEKIRYVEYVYSNGDRKHNLIEIDNSEYLDLILTTASKGSLIEKLIKKLESIGIANEDASTFMEELISSQVLVSELEPAVSGHPIMEQLLTILRSLKGCETEIRFLENLKKAFLGLDSKFGNHPDKYMEIYNLVKQTSSNCQLKYLFQTDLQLSMIECSISQKLIEDARKAMTLLNRLTIPSYVSSLETFKNTFKKRYEEEEIALSKVLDVESGIGYQQNKGYGELNPLIDDLILPSRESTSKGTSLTWNKAHDVMFSKMKNTLINGELKIVLKDSDFDELPVDWTDLPDTIYAMPEIVSIAGTKKLILPSFGGTSAANLMARFAYEGTEMNALTKEITKLEEEINSNKIIGEIVHLPEVKYGNVIMRPELRSYEIPFMAKSNKDFDFQIPIDDLMLSVRNDQLILRSKKLDKEVLPRLTNAHNFNAESSLAIYRFLSEMQTQNKRNWFGFSYGPLKEIFDFLPRVEYLDTILFPAQWNVKIKDVLGMIKVKDNSSLLREEIKKFRKRLNILQYAFLVESDNELLINFESLSSVRMLLDNVHNKKAFELKEFIQGDKGLGEDSTIHFRNQLVLPFFNSTSIPKVKSELYD